VTTAIRRNKLSTPARIIIKKDSFSEKSLILDYGCGRGDDMKYSSPLKISGWDPVHLPNKKVLIKNYYDSILCTYVLNIVTKEEQKKILKKIKTLLSPNGKAYITVRRDLPEKGRQGRGCWQRYIILDLPIFYENRNFCIYTLKKYENRN